MDMTAPPPLTMWTIQPDVAIVPRTGIPRCGVAAVVDGLAIVFVEVQLANANAAAIGATADPILTVELCLIFGNACPPRANVKIEGRRQQSPTGDWRHGNLE